MHRTLGIEKYIQHIREYTVGREPQLQSTGRPTGSLPDSSRITVAYLVLGGLWNYYAETVLTSLIRDPLLLIQFQSINLLLFVLATALLLHTLIRRAVEQIRRSEERVRCVQATAERSMREFYKSTLHAVTNGRLNLVDDGEIRARQVPDAEVLRLCETSDVAAIRRATDRAAQRIGMAEERACMLRVAVGEAASNAIKHARGGVARVGILDGTLQISIEDDGPGIATSVLPRATLMKGFSTRPSLGVGFSIVLEVADVVYLSTSARGTCLLMESDARKAPLEFLPPHAAMLRQG